MKDRKEEKHSLLKEMEVSELEDRVEFVAADRCSDNGGDEQQVQAT